MVEVRSIWTGAATCVRSESATQCREAAGRRTGGFGGGSGAAGERGRRGKRAAGGGAERKTSGGAEREPSV
uniref:Uncharacterized protein n=1 Tax=Arundo donax TaxID=35708 RepID=A0A0A9FS28_ARUDO